MATPRRRLSTIHRTPAAVRPAKGTIRSGTPVTASTGRTDDAPETSVDAAGSGSRTDHAEAAAVKVVKAAAVENRHRALRSLRSFQMERQRDGLIPNARVASFAAPPTATWQSRATPMWQQTSCGNTCYAAVTRFLPPPDTITAIVSSS